MSNYEFWDELGKIFNAVVAYQEKSVEFNKRFIHPWIRLGNVFDQDDRNKEAIGAFQKAIELDPANAQNWYELGNIHFRMKSYDEAVEAYQKAIELDPGAGWSYSNLALTLVTQGKHIEAVPLYQKSVELIEENRDKAVVWNRLGNVYRKLNEYELALQAFQNADELDAENAGFRDELDEVPQEPTLVEGGDAQPAGEPITLPIQPLQELLAESQMEETAATESEPAEPAGIPAEESQTAVATQHKSQDLEPVELLPLEIETVNPDPEPESVKVEAAEALAEDAPPDLQIVEPTPAWVDEPLATEQAQSGEAEAAEEIATPEPAAMAACVEETVAAATPESGETFTDSVAVAESATETLATQEAIPAPVEEVAMVDPEQNFDQIVLTDETPAEAVAEAAHSAEPAEVAATKSQVQAEAESPVQVVPEVAAIEHAAYDEYLKDTQSSLETQAGESGEQEAAASQEPVAKIDASGDVQIEMDTRNAHVWNELGNVYFNTGAFDDSIAAYTKAIELDRWFAWPYSNLALAYMQKGRFAEAILLYQRSIELFVSDKDKAISWNRLGNVYRRLNDYDNAIAAYQRADELDPENTTLSLQSRFSLLGTFSMEQKPSYAA